MVTAGTQILWSGEYGYVLCDDPLDRGFYIIWWPTRIGQIGELSALEHSVVAMYACASVTTTRLSLKEW